jgi:hypothetical protein
MNSQSVSRLNNIADAFSYSDYKEVENKTIFYMVLKAENHLVIVRASLGSEK